MLDRADLIASVPVRELYRARRFYGDVLGLNHLRDEPMASVFDANGTELRLTRVDAVAATTTPVVAWAVADVDEVVDALGLRGVRFERLPGVEHDRRGVATTPGGGRTAWFRDPDGNLLAVTSTNRPVPPR